MLSKDELCTQIKAICEARFAPSQIQSLLDIFDPKPQKPLVIDDELDLDIDGDEKPVPEMYQDTSTNMLNLSSDFFYDKLFEDHVKKATGSGYAISRLTTMTDFGEEPCREILVLAALIQDAAGEDPEPYLEKYIYSQPLYAVFRKTAEKYLDVYVTGKKKYEKGYAE